MSDQVQDLIDQNRHTHAASLDLSNCQLDELPRELETLHWLEKVMLPRSCGVGRWYATLAALPNLRSLNVWGDDISGIGTLGGLTSLTLRDGSVSDLAPLATLKNLRVLTLELVDIARPSSLQRLTQLDSLVLRRCSRAVLQCVSTLTQLRSLDIGRIGGRAEASKALETLDLSVLRGLLSLQSLRLVGNKVAHLADLCNLRSLRKLGLGGTGVSDLGPIRKLTWLGELDLSWTAVADLSPLSKLRSLQTLIVDRTRIEDISPIRCLTDLREFSIGRTQVSDLSPISELAALRILGAYATPITSLAFLRKLRSLKTLSVWRTKISDLSGLEGLAELRKLDISRTRVRDLAPLQDIVALEELDASHTDIEDLSPLQSLTSLHTLDVGSTKVADLSPLRTVTQLQALNVSETRVSDLMPLRWRIEEGVSVSSSDDYDPPGIFVHKCSLVSPPMEIVDSGADAIINYFRERDRGAVEHLYEAKLLIVGDGCVGKTSLVRRLYQPNMPLPKEGETTRGIDIHRHDFTLKNGRRFRLNIWDFGGQEIYHATHQFFLTRRSLYVLVDDTRTSDKSVSDPRFKYWLELVDLFGAGSPTLIFQNEKGGRTKQIDLGGIKGEYQSVKDRYGGNLEQPASVNTLRDAIEYFAGTLDHVGDELPASWLKVRADIEARAQQCPYIW
jgi:internalin A